MLLLKDRAAIRLSQEAPRTEKPTVYTHAIKVWTESLLERRGVAAGHCNVSIRHSYRWSSRESEFLVLLTLSTFDSISVRLTPWLERELALLIKSELDKPFRLSVYLQQSNATLPTAEETRRGNAWADTIPAE